MAKEISNKLESQNINVFFDENGISIVNLLELDFSEFVDKYLKEKIQ